MRLPAPLPPGQELFHRELRFRLRDGGIGRFSGLASAVTIRLLRLRLRGGRISDAGALRGYLGIGFRGGREFRGVVGRRRLFRGCFQFFHVLYQM